MEISNVLQSEQGIRWTWQPSQTCLEAGIYPASFCRIQLFPIKFLHSKRALSVTANHIHIVSYSPIVYSWMLMFFKSITQFTTETVHNHPNSNIVLLSCIVLVRDKFPSIKQTEFM